MGKSETWQSSISSLGAGLLLGKTSSEPQLFLLCAVGEFVLEEESYVDIEKLLKLFESP